MVTADKVYLESLMAGLKPDPVLTVSEWADLYRVLPQKASAEPGKWRTSRVPYLAEILDCLSPSSPVERVVLQKGSQLGGTEAGLNWIAFIIHQSPGPIMAVQPTVETGKRWSRQRLGPMIEETPVLSGTVKEPRERDSGNTILSKEFRHGVIIITGANSAVGLRSMPVRYLFLDEIDGYPADVEGEGDPCSLAEKRTGTFARRKILLVSTPTIKGLSRIEREFLASDRRRYHLRCPHCGGMQVLKWAGIEWEKDGELHKPETTAYRCEHCSKLIPEHFKTRMLEGGQWIAENPGSGKSAGFHINALYSPIGWRSWADIVAEFLKVKNEATLLKTWVNTVLGETWDETGVTVDDNNLFSRREHYGPDIPMEAVLLTAGVDVQDDRLEVQVLGWGKGEECWSIEHQTFYGPPAETTVWNLLDLFLSKTYKHESGASLKITCACVDTGGHFTSQAYAFVKPRQSRRVYAIKGSNQPGRPIVGRPSINNMARVKLFSIGMDTAKDAVYSRLRIEEPGAAFIHFPMQYDQEFFRQLTAEKIVTKYSKGFPYRTWVKVRARNEALDTFCYALAALSIFNPNLDQLSAIVKRRAEEKQAGQPKEQISPRQPSFVGKYMNQGRGKGWITSW